VSETVHCEAPKVSKGSRRHMRCAWGRGQTPSWWPRERARKRTSGAGLWDRWALACV